jgi:hypothetical protein
MQKSTEAPHIPRDWDAQAHESWEQGQRQEAIDRVLAALNRDRAAVAPVLQVAYYIFLAGDPAGAVRFLELGRKHHPDNPEVLLNLSICLYRSGQHELALQRTEELLNIRPDDITALGCKCSVLSRMHRDEEAAEAGTRSLHLKDQAARSAPTDWELPSTTPSVWAAQPGKRPVISFSLWGAHPRYLCGALDNALAAPRIYPGWTLVFFLDDTVPAQTRVRLAELGADVRLEPLGQSMREKLAWRFKVANDPTVGRFLVRDVDSVIGERERFAVDAWLASDKWFHVMRDWWTHTDLMLAGMWGGVAGVLPDLGKMLAEYRSNAAETPNVDQWFLRDCVWSYVRSSCLVHDRCFTPPGASPWPVPTPDGSFHVGQDEFAVRRQAQQQRLALRFPAA